jgi:hypothetical protein
MCAAYALYAAAGFCFTCSAAAGTKRPGKCVDVAVPTALKAEQAFVGMVPGAAYVLYALAMAWRNPSDARCLMDFVVAQ